MKLYYNVCMRSKIKKRTSIGKVIGQKLNSLYNFMAKGTNDNPKHFPITNCAVYEILNLNRNCKKLKCKKEKKQSVFNNISFLVSIYTVRAVYPIRCKITKQSKF